LPLDKNAPLCNEKIRVAKVPHDSKGGGWGDLENLPTCN